MAENEAKEPRQTRETILAELAELGYTGPTSYSKTDLLKRLDEVKDGSYAGKGAPGATDSVDEDTDSE